MTDNTQIQLAPAAGAGVGKLVADELLADPGFVPAMKAAFMGALRAEVHYYDREAKEWCSRPDDRIRLQAVMGCLAHMEGEPIKRVVHEHLSNSGVLDVAGALRESPALVEAVQREIEKAQWRTSGFQPHKRPRKVEPATLDVD